MRNHIELAWAAGFFDGEGCFRARPPRGFLYTVISQVDKRPLERFRSALGLGKILGPYSYSTKPRAQPIHHWVLHGTDVQACVAMLWPWLSEPKREQAKAMLVSWRSIKWLWQECAAKGHHIIQRYPKNFGVSPFCRDCESNNSRERYHLRKWRSA